MRKLASVQKIEAVEPIDGADAIVRVRVQDWWCVAKVNEFKVDDLCVYFEIDSILPMTKIFEFLASRGTKKTMLDTGEVIEGYRLKTIKLRGQVSQGLALPVSMFDLDSYQVGDDVTAVIGAHKYEPPQDANLAGNARGLFPSFLVKTDQERCQNLRRTIWDAYVAGTQFEVTNKLDGSSCTMYALTDSQVEKFGAKAQQSVCSRNIDLQETEGNAFWTIARQLESSGATTFIPGYAIQGELIGPGIQGNFEKVNKPSFNVFSVFDIERSEYLQPTVARVIVAKAKLTYVPVLQTEVTLRDLVGEQTQDTIVSALLNFAEGKGSFGAAYREGVVFKSVDGKFSFKAISNSYLLKQKD